MLTIGQYIDNVKIHKGMKKTAELSRSLGVERQYLYNIKKGLSTMNDSVAVKLANLSGDHPETVILIARWSTANTDIKPYYEAMYHAVNNLFTKRDKQKLNKSKG